MTNHAIVFKDYYDAKDYAALHLKGWPAWVVEDFKDGDVEGHIIRLTPNGVLLSPFTDLDTGDESMDPETAKVPDAFMRAIKAILAVYDFDETDSDEIMKTFGLLFRDVRDFIGAEEFYSIVDAVRLEKDSNLFS